MPQPSQREEQVHAAADALVAKGEKPTLEAVRQEVGGGSYSVLSPALQRWREIRKPTTQLPPLPENLEGKANSLIRDLWETAQSTAQNQLAEERATLEQAQAEAERIQLAAEEKAENAFEETEKLSKELEEARSELHAAQKRAESAETRAEQEKARADWTEAERDRLIRSLEAEREQVARLTATIERLATAPDPATEPAPSKGEE